MVMMGTMSLPVAYTEGLTRPRSDVALEALAAIQALDAEPVAVAFRDQWLAGRELFGSIGHAVQWKQGASREALDSLAKSVEHLTTRYHWSPESAEAFILRGETPDLPLVTTGVRRAAPSDPGNPAMSVFTDEIVLRCRPQATMKEVAHAYEQLRRVCVRSAGIEPGIRNRPTTSERTRDLAVLGYRIWRGDFEDWHDAFRAYEAEHPDDATEYRVKSTDKVWIKTFRRDTRAAYERVTGCYLDWRPGLIADTTTEGGD
jgi:hypothetical protein